MHVLCSEGGLERLAAELTIHNLDVVLSDAPLPPAVKAKVYTHHLGESGVVIVAAPKLAASLKPGSRNRSTRPVLAPCKWDYAAPFTRPVVRHCRVRPGRTRRVRRQRPY